MKNSSEVYRGVNRYVNFLTNEEVLEHGRVYDKVGPAKAYATIKREKSKMFRSEINGRLEYFDFLDHYVERADVWTVI